jgi:hypothetical protein
MGKLIYKDLDKIIVEITTVEFNEKGFDVIWDEIREVYKEEYKLVFHYYSNENKIIKFILKKNIEITGENLDSV